jgi:hypothetical protein
VITRFVVHRTWPVTKDNVKSLDNVRNSTGHAREIGRELWLVFKRCGCTEEYRRTPSLFGDLEFTDQVKAPYHTPPAPVVVWMGAVAQQDWEWASRLLRCKNCKKEVWREFPTFEEFVEHWSRELIIYEQCIVRVETIMQEEVFKLVSVESGDGAHFETQLLTPVEMMKYLGYADFTPNEEK